MCIFDRKRVLRIERIKKSILYFKKSTPYNWLKVDKIDDMDKMVSCIFLQRGNLDISTI